MDEQTKFVLVNMTHSLKLAKIFLESELHRMQHDRNNFCWHEFYEYQHTLDEVYDACNAFTPHRFNDE